MTAHTCATRLPHLGDERETCFARFERIVAKLLHIEEYLAVRGLDK